MVAHDLTRLPVAPGVVFTENDAAAARRSAENRERHWELPADV
jgi:hypothetical protein